jgi:hypothetical protein
VVSSPKNDPLNIIPKIVGSRAIYILWKKRQKNINGFFNNNFCNFEDI